MIEDKEDTCNLQFEQQDDVNEGHFFFEVDKLQDFGINAADLTKLKQAGFCTVKSLLMATKKEFVNIKGITDQKVEKLQEAAMKLEKGGFSNGREQLKKRKQIIKITTGSNNLDLILGGGIESQSITEVYGEYRTGKTQLVHSLCVTSQLNKADKGGQGKVLYIDTEGTFRPERIIQIAERYGLDADEALDNITYAKAYSHEHLDQLLNQAAQIMMEDNYSLIIVDSIMALFRVDFSGRGELSERQQCLGKTLSKIRKLADQFNSAVFVTNQVMSDPGSSMGAMFGDNKKPVGGNIIAHASTTRIYLRKGKGEERIAKLCDSPYLPEAEARFQIVQSGIQDCND